MSIAGAAATAAMLLSTSIGVPIAIVLGLGALVHLWLAGSFPPVIAAQRLFASADSFVLLAIPLFMTSGLLMEVGGTARRLVNFASALVGWMPGGLAVADVIASLIFADISGSAVADTAAIGSVMIPRMVAKGYGAGFATALQAAAGSLGVLFPPATMIIVYGVITNTSIMALFAATVVPGLILATSFAITAVVVAKRQGYPLEPRVGRAEVWRSFKAAIPALFAPVIIVGGIILGITTPAEAGVLAVVYLLVVQTLVFREMPLRELPRVLLRAAHSTAVVMFILGTSTILAWIFTAELVPHMFSSWVFATTTNKFAILSMVSVFLLLVHVFVEPLPAIVALVPVILEATVAVGIHPVVLGVIILVNAAAGMITPPIGLNLLVASSTVGTPLGAVSRAAVPFLFVVLANNILVIVFPELSLFLPRLLHWAR